MSIVCSKLCTKAELADAVSISTFHAIELHSSEHFGTITKNYRPKPLCSCDSWQLLNAPQSNFDMIDDRYTNQDDIPSLWKFFKRSSIP